MTATVRTRFAPSPTGYLHIGGARTALFNYLLARRHGGQFLIRIEDTDQSRNVTNADARLLDDLRWLGLQWDEGPQVGGPVGPYHQSQRLGHYTAHARRLLEEGKAYYAMETAAELEAMRQAAAKGGQARGFRYPRPKTFPSDAQAQRARDDGRPVVIRFKMPERDFVVRDTILGDVQIGAAELSDFVIVKADGWPTYHFAVVVDDELMKITHVLRGQEHLMNTPNHLGLQEAFGYRTPVYAHLPIILNMNGTKMGKREKDKAVRAALDAAIAGGALSEAEALQLAGADATTFAAWRGGESALDSTALLHLAHRLAVAIPEIQIHDFRASGYLPEVLLNFIALLGWSPGDGREKFSLAELAAAFSVERIGRTNARFDREKLLNFNTTAVATAPAERALAGLKDYVGVNDDSLLRGCDDALLARLIEMCKGYRVFRDIELKTGALLVADHELRYDPDAFDKNLLKGDGAGLKVLATMRAELAQQSDWSPAALETLIRGFGERQKLGLGKVAQPLRVAVTGNTISPPIFDTLALLGPVRSLQRIDCAIRHGNQRLATAG